MCVGGLDVAFEWPRIGVAGERKHGPGRLHDRRRGIESPHVLARIRFARRAHGQAAAVGVQRNRVAEESESLRCPRLEVCRLRPRPARRPVHIDRASQQGRIVCTIADGSARLADRTHGQHLAVSGQGHRAAKLVAQITVVRLHPGLQRPCSAVALEDIGISVVHITHVMRGSHRHRAPIIGNGHIPAEVPAVR
ncbi:hypothetical protein D3C87_1535710 [compost metagenome]